VTQMRQKDLQGLQRRDRPGLAPEFPFKALRPPEADCKEFQSIIK